MREYWGTSLRLLCILVVVLSVVGSPAVATAERSDAGADSVRAAFGPQVPFGQQSTPTPTPESNNSSDVLHENPDEVDDEDELDRLVSYLSDRMNDRISTSTLELSQGQYEAAKSTLGDDYSDSLGKYVDVEGETDEGGAGDQYEAVQQTQREYVDTVQQFRETRREYQEAKREGDDERARELARELAQLADEGATQSSRIESDLETLSNETGAGLSESQARIRTIQANISDQQAEIAALEFTPTRLGRLSYESQISYTDPLVLSGTLETTNGTPVDTSVATFEVGSQTIRAPVESDGSFTLTYHPTRVPVNTSELTLRYRPADSSVYQPTNRTLSVSITQVDATAQVSPPSASTVGYADSLAVDVALVVDDTRVGGLPLTASLAGTRLSTATTAETGTVPLDGTVPATVQTGNATLRVAPDRTDRAVSFDPVTRTVSVESEETVLDATARRSEGRTVVVEGRLTTAAGDAVTDQPVTVSVGDDTRQTVTTGATGSYRATVELPADVVPSNATITVAFDGAGTNLESTSVTTGVDRAAAGDAAKSGSNTGLPFALHDLLLAVLGTGMVGLVTVVFLRRRRGETTVPDVDDGPADSGGGPAETTGVDDPSPEASTALTSAENLLSSGRPNDAVVVAYADVRRSLAAAGDVDDSATHWEFFDHCVAAGIADAESLEELTAGYEKAGYSGRSVSEAEAETLLETAASLVDAA